MNKKEKSVKSLKKNFFVMAVIFFLGVGTGFVLDREGLFIKSSDSEKGLAVVNGKAISWDQYHLYLHKAEEGKRNPLTEDEKRLVLQRMIEEELLFQKAKKLGLIEKDPKIRKTVISSMMDFIKTNPERVDLPTNQTLKSFFEQNKPEFSPISRLKVDHKMHLKNEEKSRSTAYTPKRLLPLNSLLPYLGPSLTKISLKLKIGETAGPIEKGGYVHYIKVLERESDSGQVFFEDVKNEVLKLYQRRQREEFVKKRLLEMRKEALIYVDWSLGKKS